MVKRKSKRPKRIIYRIWNSAQRAWQFPSIIAANEVEAQNHLFKKIGYDAMGTPPRGGTGGELT